MTRWLTILAAFEALSGTAGACTMVSVKPNERWDNLVINRVPAVRAMKGFVHVPPDVHKEGTRFALQLLTRRPASVLRTVSLDDSGAFDFSDVAAPGHYLLRLFLPGSNIEGQAMIEVRRGARQASLDMDTTWSSCGTSFVDRSACPIAELHVTKLSARVADTSRAPIGRARIRLLSAEGKLIEARTDEHGRIPEIPLAAGLYQLKIESPGFTAWRAPVRIGAKGTASQWEIQMGVFGACGKVIRPRVGE